MTVVRGSANILVTLDGPAVERRLGDLVERCDVLALQEWPRGRNRLLAALGRLLVWPRILRPKPRGEWTFHRPRLGGGPIGVRNGLGERALSCKAVALVGPGRMDPAPGRRTLLGPSWATRLKSERPDDSIVVRYNIHLTASVQHGKVGYRKDHPKRVARHKAERRALERRIARDHAKGYDVEVYGDVNFHHMPIAGLRGWWPVRPDAGTFGDRAIDGVWTTGPRPDLVELLPPLVRGEHRHVVTQTRSPR